MVYIVYSTLENWKTTLKRHLTNKKLWQNNFTITTSKDQIPKRVLVCTVSSPYGPHGFLG